MTKRSIPPLIHTLFSSLSLLPVYIPWKSHISNFKMYQIHIYKTRTLIPYTIPWDARHSFWLGNLQTDCQINPLYYKCPSQPRPQMPVHLQPGRLLHPHAGRPSGARTQVPRTHQKDLWQLRRVRLLQGHRHHHTVPGQHEYFQLGIGWQRKIIIIIGVTFLLYRIIFLRTKLQESSYVSQC